MKFFTLPLLVSFCLMAVCSVAQTFTGTPQTLISEHNQWVTDVGENSSLLVINGRPAISYRAKRTSTTTTTGTGAGAHYIRANDASGSDWPESGTQAAGFTSLYSTVISNLTVAAGNPFVAFNSTPYGAIFVRRANNGDGEDTWNAAFTSLPGTSPGVISSAIVNGNPAISFINLAANSRNLMYVRANDPGGTSWGEPVVLRTNSMALHSSLVVVDGRPAIAYIHFENGNRKITYVRAEDENGTAWGSHQVIDSYGQTGVYASMQIIDGRPAVAYQDWTNNNLKYVRANDATGSSWDTPITLDADGDTGYNISLAVVNGVPAISYLTKRGEKVELRFIHGLDADGNTWTASQQLDEMTLPSSPTYPNEYSGTSLAEVNGTPAISYYDIEKKDLKYIRSTTPIFNQPGPPIVHVKVGGTGDGSSWANAMGDVQEAVNSPDVEQVWVAQGTYYPQGDGLKMKNGVAIYGGFPDDDDDAGMEERDWEVNPTILHGNNENRRVVSNEFDEEDELNDSAILDGFTITGGNSNYAGGISNYYASPVLRNLVITGNQSIGEGGAMYNGWCAPTLSNVIISGNSTSGYGGGIYNENASPLMTGVTIAGNSALVGGGIYNRNASPVLTGVTISHNTAGEDGGGVYNENSSPTLTGVTISHNEAGIGGGIYNNEASAILTNVLIHSNKATRPDGNGGGGIYNGDNSSLTVINTTITNNSSPHFGNGITNAGTSSLVYNSIIWGNEESDYRGELDDDSDYNMIGGGVNPLFKNPAASDYSLSLFSTAIGVGSNSAYGDLTGALDLAGNPRLWGIAIDLGAYERQEAGIAPGIGNILYVNQNVSGGDGSGSSWANALPQLADALLYARAANNYTEENPLKIYVARGIYKPLYHADDNEIWWVNGDRHNSFVMVKNVQVYGGFDPVAEITDLSHSRLLHYNTAFEEQTVLSGDIGQPDVDSDNVYNVVIAAGDVNNSRLDGFTIVGGNADFAESSRVNGEDVMRNLGGAVNNWYSSPALANLYISRNSASYGGGISNWNSSAVITNVTIDGNSADKGAGIYNDDAAPVLINLLVSGNTASEEGGGIYNSPYSITVLTNATISGNTALNEGSEWYSSGGTPVIRNSIIWGNGVYGQLTDTQYSLVQDQTVDGNENYYAEAYNNLYWVTDPMFINPATGDYRLLYCSPGVNAGTPDITGLNLPPVDLLGQERIFDGRIDLGAFENHEGPSSGPEVAHADQELERIQSPNGTTDYLSGCTGWLASITTTGQPTDISGSTTVQVWIDETQPAQYVRRYYQISPADNASTATGRVTLYFTQDDFDAFSALNSTSPLPDGPMGDVTNLIIEKRGGESSDGTGSPASYPGTPENITAVEVVWSSEAQRWEVSFNVTGFSGFFVKTTNSPLPVRWISFSAELNDQHQAVLDWKVDEVSVDRYEVERSANGKSFSAVATVTTRGDGLHDYRVTDPFKASGNMYYRIRQIDLDGSYLYSRVVSVSAPEVIRLRVFPNPTVDKVTVEIGAEYVGAKLRLINTSGVLLQEVSVSEPTLTVSLQHYAPGLYMLYTFDGRVVKLIRE